MDAFIYMFFLPILAIPLWFFLVPLGMATVLCLVFWKRETLRSTVFIMGLIISLVIAIPPLGLHMYFSARAGDGKTRLNIYFGDVINPDSVARHRFRLAGLGDTDDLWKLKHIDPNECQRVIQTFGLELMQHDRPSSLMERPWWWPKSTGSYCVYQGDDGFGGSTELWIPKEGSSVYLFKFTE